jgi:ketosteroid isomerase-like protein
MKRRTLPMLATVLLVGILHAQTQSSADKASDSAVRDTLHRLFAAWSDLNPAKTAHFYAKDRGLVFFDIAPMKYDGWSEYEAGVPKAFAPYKSGKFSLNDDLRVHRQGNLAWATATWGADLLKKAGGTEHMEGRYTGVLEKRGKDWLVIHEHMSVPPPGQ